MEKVFNSANTFLIETCFQIDFVKSPNKFECLDINPTRGVSHCGLAIYIKKYLKAKEELWKLKYFTMQK
jgi:hypothetical protein